MTTPENTPIPVFSHVEPILSVQDINATVQYWTEVIGFPAKWTWGDPPVHGGVSWQNIFVQFSLNPEHAVHSKGCTIWVKVSRLETLYRIHQEKKADIVAPLKQQPWGMADYTLRDNNGHYVCFSGNIDEREHRSTALPPSIRITGRIPTVREFQQVQAGVGWGSNPDDEKTAATLAAVLHAAIAEDSATGQIIGCALLLGDKVSFYYVKDVMVHKEWQGRHVGSALMQELTRWLEANVTHHALVGLFCRESLEPFYKPFGFTPGFGMLRYINPS